jgi:hypothetical protein
MRGFALLAAGSLVAAPFLTGCSSSVASATTSLRGVLAATVVHTDGSSRPAINGLALHPGDVVRTGDGGRAELVTQKRVVYVGSDAAIQVVDGLHQVLRAGAIVADAQAGPDLDLTVASLDVSVPAGSATRAERSVTSRIAALAGPTDVRSTAGRRLTIDVLHQAVVGGDALPDTTTPLRLTDDDGEAHAVPTLVRDDETLNGLARGMDSTGPSTARVITASADFTTQPAPSGVGRSERLLPAVIAATGSSSGAEQRYTRAVDYRKAGGSWGVIAHLLGVQARNVVATLAAFERTQPPGRIGSVSAVLASAGIAPDGGGTHATDGTRRTGGSRQGSDTADNGGQPSGGPSPSPSPSSSGPVGTVLDTVNDTVGDVLSLLPKPTPSPTQAAHGPTLPVPLPVPLPSVSLPPLPIGHSPGPRRRGARPRRTPAQSARIPRRSRTAPGMTCRPSAGRTRQAPPLRRT